MPGHTTRARRRAGRLLLGLAALTALLALLVAVPLVLLVAWHHLGPPWPSGRELLRPDDGTLFVRVLCLVGWAGWATFAWAVLAEALAQASNIRLPTWAWQQRTAAVLVTAITMMFSSPAIAGATATPVHAAAVTAPDHAEQPADATTGATAAGPALTAQAGFIEHVVQPGEQMPALAERFLGDKYQWHAIAAATYGITQPDGRQLRPGDTRVYPGWTVRVPAPARENTTTTPASYTTTSTTSTVPGGDMVYQVRHGDYLWYIAERFLGDPLRYPDIAKLNPRLAAKYGSAFPDHIEADDQIRLPTDAHDRGPRPHATGTIRTPAPVDASDPPNTDPPQQASPADTDQAPPPPTPSASISAPTPATPAPSTSPTPSPVPSRPAAVPAPNSTSTAPTSQTNPPTASGSTGPAHVPPGVNQQHPKAGIDLGDRGWVTAEVATAVAAAAALVWIHRRRRYRPHPPGPAHRTDPDLAPLPHTVTALHHARPTTAEDNMDASKPQTQDAALVTTASLGNQQGKLLRLTDLPTLGIGLVGPGAASAARGLLASVLSAGGPWAPGTQATIITTTSDLHRILSDHEHVTPGLDRLHVADTVEHALDELERTLLRRARIASDTTDLATALGTDDDAPPPAVFLTSAPTGALATRLAAVLTVGARLAIVGVLIDTWPAGQTWQVNPDGTTLVDGHPGPRLNILDHTATMQILDTLRQAHPAEDDPPTGPARRIIGIPPGQPHAATAPPTQPNPAAVTTPTPPTPNTTSAAEPRLRLTVLGRPTIQLIDANHHTDIRIRRRDGVQILVHLAVNPDGATSDQLMALLWPEVRPHLSRRQFHTTISELRQTLAEAAGADPISRTDLRYHLDPSLVEVDLWTLNGAIDQAATTVDPVQHTAALRQIIALYTGSVADGHDWLWLAPYREATRRHIIDAYAALAEEEPQPGQALALIQDAIRLDPYNEDLYQQAMRLHARLASTDGVRRTLRTLTERLAELEIPISPQTQQVAAELIERLGIRERVHHGAA